MAFDPQFASDPASNMRRAFDNVAAHREDNRLRFHFDCYAVCEIEPPDPEYPVDRDNRAAATLILGLFSSPADAKIAIAQRERELRERHREWQRRTGWGDTYSPRVYEIVPLANVRFASLDELERQIGQAAILQFDGVGKESGAA